MSSFWHNLPQPFFILAPMEAVTDVVFRHVIAAATPPDVWFSEFTNATGWVHAGQKAIGGRLIKTDDEQPIVAQIWGGEPGDMEQLAHHCAELGYHGIDINMGCPAKSAVKSGGSALIRQPDLAVASIAAAKSTGLPISVKTRLGYTSVDEWRNWLTTLLEQDIANLTIHLRTKKEMSKVPAHHELIPEIVKLRDEIAPQTLLTINGDIANRVHGEQLVRKNPGVNGVMIGRGIFHDPFAFSENESRDRRHETRSGSRITQKERDASILSEGGAVTTISAQPKSGQPNATGVTDREPRKAYPTTDDGEADRERLINLLELHLELFDTWQPELNRPYETLKRFFKIYVCDFDGAKELRDQLMHTKTTDEAREIISRL